MNPRTFLNFFKTKTGKVTLFALIFVAILLLLDGFRKGRAAGEWFQASALGVNLPTEEPQLVQTIHKPMEVFRPPPPKPEPPPAGPATAALSVESPPLPPPPLPPIALFTETPTPEPKTLSPNYAPFGRLISCETVITIDSSSIRTPIVGLVIEDIYHAGRLIIPAGTEVHGTAQTDRLRERIASGSSWMLVWQTGEEMPLKGIALDREFSKDQAGWGITDGSAGLRGRIIKSDDLAEIRLFAATFLSGAAGALTEKEQTIFGTLDRPSLDNAPYKGAQEVLKVYAQRIYETIQRDGFYVRVPSGKQFYLYVLQTIDREEAQIGASATPLAANAEEEREHGSASNAGASPPPPLLPTPPLLDQPKPHPLP